MNFTPLDWAIVAVYLALTLAAGLAGRRYIKDASDFLLAGRHLGKYIGIATLAATEIGTITFMYYAELGYKTGFASFVNGLIARWGHDLPRRNRIHDFPPARSWPHYGARILRSQIQPPSPHCGRRAGGRRGSVEYGCVPEGRRHLPSRSSPGFPSPISAGP